MRLTVHPGNPLRGTALVPGDKSLSHRALLFAAMAEGESRIENFLVSGVTRVMLDGLSQLGVEWSLEGSRLIVRGRGLDGLRMVTAGQKEVGGWKSADDKRAPLLNCGNSATTLRLIAGALAAAGAPAVLDGSAGLRKRPMERIVEPLRRMGVGIDPAPGGTAPLAIHARPLGQSLRPFDETLPVASAQVKTCLLLAGLAAGGKCTLREPGPSRDHTERMLRSMGVEISSQTVEVSGRTFYETSLIPPSTLLRPICFRLPGDFSAAAFLIAAALITPGSEVRIPGVGLNPTRTGLLDVLRGMGGEIGITGICEQAGEPVGDLLVRASRLRGARIGGEMVVRMIDEFSVFGAAAAFAEDHSEARDAGELRYKESDRIATLCQTLNHLSGTRSAAAVETPDGFIITGGGDLAGGTAQAHGDHRVAMAAAVTGLAARSPVTVEGAEIIGESFPGFIDQLQGLGAALEIGPEQGSGALD